MHLYTATQCLRALAIASLPALAIPTLAAAGTGGVQAPPNCPPAPAVCAVHEVVTDPGPIRRGREITCRKVVVTRWAVSSNEVALWTLKVFVDWCYQNRNQVLTYASAYAKAFGGSTGWAFDGWLVANPRVGGGPGKRWFAAAFQPRFALCIPAGCLTSTPMVQTLVSNGAVFTERSSG